MKRSIRYLLAVACAGTLASPLLSAQPEMGGHQGPPGGPDRGRGSHLQRGWPGLPPGADLSEAQQQKAFALRHAAEPLMFEQNAQVRKAHDALRRLADTSPFDEARASAAANALGSATSALALNHARLAAQMTALLTPEQRTAAALHAPVPGRQP
jgi:Spy/CpxP family protein refolding chaperone